MKRGREDKDAGAVPGVRCAARQRHHAEDRRGVFVCRRSFRTLSREAQQMNDFRLWSPLSRGEVLGLLGALCAQGAPANEGADDAGLRRATAHLCRLVGQARSRRQVSWLIGLDALFRECAIFHRLLGLPCADAAIQRARNRMS